MTTEDNTSAVITLPKTKLSVRSGHLVLLSQTDRPISAIDMASITNATVRMETDWAAIILPLGLFAIAGACRWYFASTTLGWFLCVVVGIFGLIAFLGLKRPVLTVITKDGQANIDIKDTMPEAEAFVLSLKQQTGNRQA